MGLASAPLRQTMPALYWSGHRAVSAHIEEQTMNQIKRFFIGMTMVIITGGIDLSVGSLTALASVVATRLIRDQAGGDASGERLERSGRTCVSWKN